LAAEVQEAVQEVILADTTLAADTPAATSVDTAD